MKVYFIGAGPGAADLITLRAKALIETCPVILYAGSLIPQDVLSHAQEHARLINTASLDLEVIMAEIKTAAARGENVARLHSGDPSLYSAIGEQARELQALGINYEIIPGVPAFAAAAAAMGQELTVPELCQTLILTRTEGRASKMPEAEALENLARTKATLAIHLSAKQTEKITNALTPHYGSDCPVIIAANISQKKEVLIETTLVDLTKDMITHQIERTAIIFVGRALAKTPGQNSALYSKSHDRYLKPADK